jgi:hypothetical protein
VDILIKDAQVRLSVSTREGFSCTLVGSADVSCKSMRARILIVAFRAHPLADRIESSPLDGLSILSWRCVEDAPDLSRGSGGVWLAVGGPG